MATSAVTFVRSQTSKDNTDREIHQAKRDLERELRTGDPARKYNIGKELGKGSYGRVFRAERSYDGAMVAIKVISLEKFGTGEDYLRGLKNILKEIRILREINSDYVVKYYDGYMKRDTVWLVLELLDGVEAFDLKSDLPSSCIARVCRGMLEALLDTHHRNVIHHDIKLENVMVTRRGQVKIIDMGLALKGGATFSWFSGTVAYAAPEMFDKMRYDSSVDIWALGVCLFFLATGCVPYEGDSVDDIQREFIKKGELDNQEKLLLADPDLQDFISRCLKFNRHERPTAYELLRHPFVRSAADREYMALIVKRTKLEKSLRF